jgi:hypothetical protein
MVVTWQQLAAVDQEFAVEEAQKPQDLTVFATPHDEDDYNNNVRAHFNY